MKHQIEIFTAFLEIFLLCGLVYAWPVFDHILKKEAVYEELCGATRIAENGTCQAQKEIFLRVTSAGSLLLSFGCLVVGLFLDRFGLRITRIYVGLLLTFSFIMLYFLDLSSHLMWPFWLSLAFGIIGPLYTAFGLANYFPKYKMTIIMLCDGIFDSSVGATAVWTYFYDKGMTLKTMALFFIGVMGFYWFRTFILLPVKNPEEEKMQEKDENDAFLDENNDKKLSGINWFVSKLSLLKNKSAILLLSSYLILDVRIVLTFYIFPTILEEVYDDPDERLAASQFFTKANTLSFLVCWIPGVLADKFHRGRTLNLLMICLIFMLVTVSVLPLLGTPFSITLVSLIFPMCRTMFYGVISMIIVEKYPTDMGFMFGIANVTAGFVLFFLTNYIASNTDFLDQIMLVLGIFCAACIVYPLYELREMRREEIKRNQEERQQNESIVLKLETQS